MVNQSGSGWVRIEWGSGFGHFKNAKYHNKSLESILRQVSIGTWGVHQGSASHLRPVSHE